MRRSFRRFLAAGALSRKEREKREDELKVEIALLRKELAEANAAAEKAEELPAQVTEEEEQVNNQVEAINLSHDTMKHISTLVTASIVAIVTLLKTVFADSPHSLWLGFLSIVSLIIATVCAVFTMSGLVFYRSLMTDLSNATEREDKVNQGLRIVFGSWSLFFAQLLCLGAFVFGLFLFACFSVVNLWH